MSNYAFDLAIAAIIGMLIGWLAEWLWDSRQRRRDAADHRAEIGALEQSLDDALVARSAAEHEMSALQEAHNEVLNRNKSLDALTQQLQSQQATLEQEVTDSRTQLRKMASIKQANDTLRNKLNSAEASIRSLSSNNDELNTRTQNLGKLQNELEQSRSRVEKLEADRLTLRDKLAHTETELATMGAQYAANVEDMGDLAQMREQYAQAKREIERLRANRTTATAESERVLAMRTQIEDLETRLEAAEDALLHEQNRVVALDVKLQNMADKLTDERLRAQAVENELDSIRSGQASADIARMRAEMAAQELEISELRTKLTVEEVNPALQPTTILPPPTSQSRSAAMDPNDASSLPSWMPRGTASNTISNTTAQQDRLQVINGIGNVFAERLRQAGIDSFVKLSQLTPDQAAQIVRAKSWQAVDAASWIEQARQLANSGEVT